MNLLRSAAALALAGAVTIPVAAFAQSTVPAGTTFTGRLEQALNTASASDGDNFTMDVTSPYPNGDAGYANSRIHGHLRNVVRAGQGRKAQLQLAFDNITFANGQSAPLHGTVTQMNPTKQNTVGRQVAGVVIGDLVGNYLGKHVGGGLSNYGWALGAAGGYLYASNMKANFSVPSGSTVQLQSRNTVSPSGRRQAGY